MNAKHQTKNAISHKFVFLAASIAIAIIAAFSICATSQANAEDSDSNAFGEWQLLVSDDFTEDYTLEIYTNDDTYSGEPWDNGHFVNEYVLLDDFSNADYIGITQDHTNYHELYFDFFNNADNERFRGYDFDVHTSAAVGSNTEFSWYLAGYGQVPYEGDIEPIIIKADEFDDALLFSFTDGPISLGVNVSGHVADANDVWQAVPGAFVQYCQWNPWFWDYVPVPEMSTFTDWFGHYTIEGVTEEMLPGVIRVYRYGYEVGESWPIWGAPEGEDTVYRFVEMVPAEPPVPPTPPDPPVPPVPPRPDPPQPVPPTPVPPTPVPTPVDPGTNVPQTGDSGGCAFAIFAMFAILSFGVFAGRKLYNR